MAPFCWHHHPERPRTVEGVEETGVETVTVRKVLSRTPSSSEYIHVYMHS